MKSRIIMALICVFVLSFAVVAALAQTVPQLVNYQGRLTDSSGQPLADGTTVDLTFYFYGVETGPTPLYLTVLQEDVVVTKGIYNVLIGSGTITPGTETGLAAVFQNHQDVWMGVKVDSDNEMTPRSRIASAPYAMAFDLDFLYSTKDFDNDGYDSTLFGGSDCNDADSATYPGATEIPGDSIDQSCDGYPYGPVDICAKLEACEMWEDDDDCATEMEDELFVYYESYSYAPMMQLASCMEGATCGGVEACVETYRDTVKSDLCNTLDSCGYMTASECQSQLDSADTDFDEPLEQTLCLLDAATCATIAINQCLTTESYRYWKDVNPNNSPAVTYSMEASVMVLFSDSTENIDLKNSSGVTYDMVYGSYGCDWEWYYRWDYSVTGGASFAELYATWPPGDYTVLRDGSTIDSFTSQEYSLSDFVKQCVGISPSTGDTIGDDPLSVFWQLGALGQPPEEGFYLLLDNITRGVNSSRDDIPASATSAQLSIPTGTQYGDYINLALGGFSGEYTFMSPLNKFFEHEFSTFNHEIDLKWGGP